MSRAPHARESQAKYLVAGAKSQAKRETSRAPELRALFDVNVLIALLDSDHLHHARAAQWLAEHIETGWASCAITQNGCVRIMSQPGYPNPLPTARVAQRMRAATATPHHLYVEGAPSLLDEKSFDSEQLLGHRQVTDAWLVGLAVRHRLRLVTFDAHMPLRVVRGSTPHHLVVL